MRSALRILIGFLYRLVFFPFFTAIQVISTVANQVHWLVTGMTFEEAAARTAKPSFDELKKFYTRH